MTEGSETTNIDIVVGRPVTTFKVSGRSSRRRNRKAVVRTSGMAFIKVVKHGGSSRIGEITRMLMASSDWKMCFRENMLSSSFRVTAVSAETMYLSKLWIVM